MQQADYTNAFAQAEITEEVYVGASREFFPKQGDGDDVLKLRKSIYGLRQAPRQFYEKLRKGLASVDQSLFMKKDVICVVYIDDTIFTGPNAAKLEAEITALGVPRDETQRPFELRNGGELGDLSAPE